MSDSPLTLEQIWGEIDQFTGDDSPVREILHALIEAHRAFPPQIIKSYDLERVVKQLNFSKDEVWKRLIDFLCIQTALLELHFQLIDDEDQDYEISLEMLQSIINGESLKFGSKVYSSSAIQLQIFPYFIPTKKFLLLLNARKGIQ